MAPLVATAQRVDQADHQSIDFVNDVNVNEHIDLKTGNQKFNTRFTSDGKVGIGTTTPTAKLEVKDGTVSGDLVILDMPDVNGTYNIDLTKSNTWKLNSSSFNQTLTFSNADKVAGAYFTIIFPAGMAVPNFSGNWYFPEGDPSMGAQDIGARIGSFVCDGTNLYGGINVGFQKVGS